MIYTTEQLNIIRTNIISIGTCCSFNLYKQEFFRKEYLKYNTYNKLELRNINKGITNFFDWLICEYPNNVRILNMDINEIQKTLSYDNWRINRRKDAMLEYNIDFNGSYLIKSIHDLNENSNVQEDLVNKYIRRYTRLIDLIKTTQNLIFIYDSYLPDEHINKIIESIKRLTPYNFIIIIFDVFENDFKTQYKKNDNIYRINFNVLSKLSQEHTLHHRKRTNNIDVEQLFNIIINHIYTDI
jgi:hypothetical protein